MYVVYYLTKRVFFITVCILRFVKKSLRFVVSDETCDLLYVSSDTFRVEFMTVRANSRIVMINVQNVRWMRCILLNLIARFVLKWVRFVKVYETSCSCHVLYITFHTEIVTFRRFLRNVCKTIRLNVLKSARNVNHLRFVWILTRNVAVIFSSDVHLFEYK